MAVARGMRVSGLVCGGRKLCGICDWIRLRHSLAIAQSGQPFNNVARSPVFFYLGGMDVHFNPDLQARLTQRAARQGRNLDETVQDVVARYFEEEDRFIEP